MKLSVIGNQQSAIGRFLAVCMDSKLFRTFLVLGAAAVVLFLAGPTADAQGIPKPTFVERAETPEDVVSTIELLLLLTVLTLAPSILIMTTAFTRIIIVLSFLRRALGTNELPPNQLLIGLALILTAMVMRPTITDIKDNAMQPYLDGAMTQDVAFKYSVDSLRQFMFAHVDPDDLRLFKEINEDPQNPETWTDYGHVDTFVLIPAFVTSELKRGFYMGFILYLPFLVIDLVIATVLISMGMLVLPPVLISLPFKLLLFVMVDGWNLVVMGIVRSFQIAPTL
jgi:flagellar biosynthetic protein FliP